MGLFDKLRQPVESVPNPNAGGSNRTVDVQFAKLPDTLEEFRALPQAQLSSPFETAMTRSSIS